jgi:DNA-binding response OmpR family regulator
MDALLFATNPDEAAILSVILNRAGLRAQVVKDVERLLRKWPLEPHSFFLLAPDKAIPAAWIQQIRSHTDMPLLMIAPLLPEEDQIEMYSAGVDVLLARPYSSRVLVAQIKALMRRGGAQLFLSPSYTLGEVTLDPSQRTVQIGEERAARLTQLEFRLLYTLMLHAGQIMSSETLVTNVWGYDGAGEKDLVRGLVKRLRNKVEPDIQNPRYIRNEPGLGYVFTYEESS